MPILAVSTNFRRFATILGVFMVFLGVSSGLNQPWVKGLQVKRRFANSSLSLTCSENCLFCVRRRKTSSRPSRAALLKGKEVLAFSKFDLMSATWVVGAIQKRIEDLQGQPSA